MPRENRKRGKRRKIQAEQSTEGRNPAQEIAENPSWIVSSSKAVAVDAEAPFGEVEADVKAYFRTVDLQIRDWQGNLDETVKEDDVQPNESAKSGRLNCGYFTEHDVGREAHALYGRVE
jgi:nucleolar protein 9